MRASRSLFWVIATVLPISQADLRNFVEHNLFGAAKELSDQVVLNPPVPNQMGAFWAKQSNELPSWMLEVNYRINGPDRGGKGLAVWYTKNRGQGGHIYGGPDNWDGLGLFLTAESDGTGALRGHLNDGNFAFARAEAPGTSPFSIDRSFAKTNAEKHAFGACKVQHRNVGTIGSIKLIYNVASLKVYHNDALCFENAHVSLPSQYYFGVSSQSDEIPDSHELFGVHVSSVPTEHQPQAQAYHSPPVAEAHPQQGSGSQDALAMQQALKALSSDVAIVKSQLTQMDQIKETLSRLQEAVHRTDATVSSIQSTPKNQAQIGHLEASLKDLSSQVSRVNDRFVSLEKHVQQQLEQSRSKQSGGVYVLIAAQIILLGLYTIYRKRRDAAKSKFL